MKKEYINVFIGENGETMPLEVVGEYDGNPVVTWLGHELVAEYCYISPEGTRVSSVYNSRGCDYCNGTCLGCRYGDYKDNECMPYLSELPNCAINPVVITVVSPTGDVEEFPIENHWDILVWLEEIALRLDTKEFQDSDIRYNLDCTGRLVGECKGNHFLAFYIKGDLWETECSGLLNIISKFMG